MQRCPRAGTPIPAATDNGPPDERPAADHRSARHLRQPPSAGARTAGVDGVTAVHVSIAGPEVFLTMFARTGSAYGVVQAFTGRKFPLRAYGGVWAGQLRWGKLTHGRALGVLSNPAYAGAYAYGQHRIVRTVRPDGTVKTSSRVLPRDQWQVLIHDHHEGYLTWQQYLDIETKLAANRTNAGARPPREGSPPVSGHHQLRSLRSPGRHPLSGPRPGGLLRLHGSPRRRPQPTLPLGGRVDHRHRGGPVAAVDAHRRASPGTPDHHDPHQDHIWQWSWWRRRHQYRAQTSHYQRRLRT
ncbi:hypothetical protein Ari01nite_83980 [Paractinoplanes rishiriensis]|uniref:Recombinase domain-containing protein n=1 Tax=Paractinoplanes rishiriensis TaxID=1050105 RepID=A0A919K6D4_9ACTN|nr:hypothetical protein Ari01nite_83980 [Actinoplanes rishiriensis]